METIKNASLISIVMPAYNCEQYISQAVESVIKQTYEEWELIIIDDCSKDGTYTLIKNIAEQDSRIRIYQNDKNIGVGKTRNRGIELAAGDWIAFLDSDDLWEKMKLEKQIHLLEQEFQAKFIYTGSAFIYADGTVIDYILHVPKRINRSQLLKQNLVSCSSVMIRKEYMQKYPMPGQKDIHEDFAVWLNVLEDEKYAYGIDEPLLIYRKSENSKSGNKLKAAKMNWNTYKNVGINGLSRFYYMCWYAVKGILKYKNLV